MEEDTIHIKKEEAPSKIFNTSVRGWIALVLTVVLGATIFLIVASSFFGVSIESRVSDQLIALFSAGFGGAVTQYFNQKSREGQK